MPNQPKEKHHIIPESFFINRSRVGPIGWLEGDPEISGYIILLTPREHAFCHKLLVKMTEGKMKSKMQLAIWRMMNGKSRKFFSTREYELHRKLFIENISLMQKGKKKSPLTEEHKLKLSKSSKNIPKSEITKKNMKDAWKLRDNVVKETTKELNRIASTAFWSLPESKENQSARRKQFLSENPDVLKQQIVQLNKTKKCEYCGCVTNLGNYKRWHGEKCKLNKIS
jgi:hypothetical protein